MAGGTERSRAITLIATLIDDTIAARHRLEATDTQTARRDVVRASFAAMEGAVWLARDHVRENLNSADELTTLADLALREKTYVVTKTGGIVEQARSVPLLTAIRLVVSQAQIICPTLAVDFTAEGWAKLRDAVAIRNRITHPRPENDLHVTSEELATIASGLNWLLATTDYVMASTNLMLVHTRQFIDQLLVGDPEALAQYQAALERNR